MFKYRVNRKETIYQVFRLGNAIKISSMPTDKIKQDYPEAIIYYTGLGYDLAAKKKETLLRTLDEK